MCHPIIKMMVMEYKRINKTFFSLLQSELDSALDGLNGDFSSDPDAFYRAVNNCPYLDMVVAEANRMHMGQMIIRTCTKDSKIPGTEVKEQIKFPHSTSITIFR